MPYRHKISDIVNKKNYKFICKQMVNNRVNRIYQITGTLHWSTMRFLADDGFDIRVLNGAVLVARPSQMRSYKTE